MPHAVSPSPERDAAANMDDTAMTDAPAQPLQQAQEQDGQPPSSAAELPTQSAPASNGKSLEDMFDDDSDDEFSSSAPIKPEDSSQPEPSSGPSAPKYADPVLLGQFYQRLFPFRPLFQWL
ncbi:hypothetical protein KC352_g35265, partial [Hortaea werneckii]